MKIRLLLIATLVLFAFMSLSLSLPAYAQNPTPTATDTPSCDASILAQQIIVYQNDNDTQGGYQDLSVLDKMIQGYLGACGYVGPTPVPTATKVGTLSPAEVYAATNGARIAQRTSTAAAVGATATFVAQYKQIDARELVSYADKHTGEKVIVQGTIFNIDGDIIQIMANGNFDQPIYINLAHSPSGVYKNDFVVVYGTVSGYATFDNANGATISQAQLTDAVIKGK